MNSQLYITTRMMFSAWRARVMPHAVSGPARGVPVQRCRPPAAVAAAAVLSVVAPNSAFILMVSIAPERCSPG